MIRTVIILKRIPDDVTILIYILDISDFPTGPRTQEQRDHWKRDTRSLEWLRHDTAVETTVELAEIHDTMALTWRGCNLNLNMFHFTVCFLKSFYSDTNNETLFIIDP